MNWAAVHVKPVGFLNDAVCFKLSSVVVVALYQVKKEGRSAKQGKYSILTRYFMHLL